MAPMHTRLVRDTHILRDVARGRHRWLPCYLTVLGRFGLGLRFVRSRQRFVRWSHCPMSQSITARPMRYAAPADQATTPITSISGLKPPQPPPPWPLQNSVVNYVFLDNRYGMRSIGQTFHDKPAPMDLGSCPQTDVDQTEMPQRSSLLP